MPDSTTPTLAEAVAALLKFSRDLRQHRNTSDYENWLVGAPARPELIAHYRANPRLLPPELVDLYELMDGCHLSWGFVSKPLPELDADEAVWEQWEAARPYEGEIASFQLPRLSQATLHTDYENGYTFFGPGTLSLRIDAPQPEYGTWLVAYGPGQPRAYDYAPYNTTPPYEPDPAHNPNPAADAAAYATADVAQARLVFLHSKDDELPLPVGLAEYILAGISYGFINNWQLACWGGEGYRSRYLPAIEEALARLASGK